MPTDEAKSTDGTENKPAKGIREAGARDQAEGDADGELMAERGRRRT